MIIEATIKTGNSVSVDSGDAVGAIVGFIVGVGDEEGVGVIMGVGEGTGVGLGVGSEE